MRISERGQITIPKQLRERFGMNHNVEVVITPTDDGLLIQKRKNTKHPVDRVYAVIDNALDTDDYIDQIRGR